jgi:hypothetical protein
MLCHIESLLIPDGVGGSHLHSTEGDWSEVEKLCSKDTFKNDKEFLYAGTWRNILLPYSSVFVLC